MLKNIKWLGHSSFKITGDKIIYIDPWKVGEEEPGDIILVSHEHFDHCSRSDVQKLSKDDTTIVTIRACEYKLYGKRRIVKPGDEIIVKGIEIEAVPAYNIGKPYHQKAVGRVGFIITVDEERIYFAGDTDIIPEMKDIKADIALLPVGGTYTMNAEEASQAANMLKPEIAIPMHWGDFVGTRKDAERFKELCNTRVDILEVSKQN